MPMRISVVYALPGRQAVRALELPEGSTLAAALQQCGLERDFPELDLATATVGVYGRIMPRHTVLQAGDRIEIYRELRAEPREMRRKRARNR